MMMMMIMEMHVRRVLMNVGIHMRARRMAVRPPIVQGKVLEHCILGCQPGKSLRDTTGTPERWQLT